MVNWTKCHGLIAATFTPLNSDLSLNFQQVPTYIDYLLASGVKQVFVNGTSGECMSLTVDERKAMAVTWIATGRGRLDKIIIQCGAGNLAETRELALHGAELNADCVAITTPTYFKPHTVDDLVDYCCEIASTIPQTPVMYYHYPDKTGVNFKMHDFFDKVSKNKRGENIIGCKFTSNDLADAHQVILMENGKYDVIIGADTIFLGALAMGLHSSIGISYNVCGTLMNKMIEHFEKNNLVEARNIQAKVQDLFRRSHEQGHSNEMIAMFKYSMKMIDPALDMGPVRRPIRQPTKEKLENMRNLLKNLNIIR